ncbi:MAG: prenyltransferase/squalene oxidase repeat-containing protein [Planctomycetota bacterium]
MSRHPGRGPRRARAALGALLLVALAGCVEPAPEASSRARPRPDRLRAAIAAAADHLQRACDAEGRFAYLRRAAPGGAAAASPAPSAEVGSAARAGAAPSSAAVTSAAPYNILRHAGALYALEQHHRRTGAEASRAALLRGARFLLGRLRPVTLPTPSRAGAAPALAIASLPGEEVAGPEPEFKLGGAGLGLVALCAARRLDPAAVDLEALRGLGRFLLAAQREDGGFQSRLDADGWDEDFVSLYYPGEAILGLLRLHALDPRPEWLHAARAAAEHLARARRELAPEELPHDHWLLIAGAELLALGDDLLVRGHLEALGAAFLARWERVAEEGSYPGSFHSDGLTCPTATRVEGLVALTPLLQGEARTRALGAARAGAAYLLECQLPDGAWPPAHPRDGLAGPRGELRIDYTQHALSALLGVAALEGR